MGSGSGKLTADGDSEVNLGHFRLLKVIGRGAFGKVRIVEHRSSGLAFALKYFNKDKIIQGEHVRNILRERRMLEQLHHPFLCNLRYSFQDTEFLYIVVDLMSGGDLRYHLSRTTFTEWAVRFWIAEIACALNYIHSQGIVHRDVKPDNVLLDLNGHVHLADFNVAAEFSPNRVLTSRSGTLAYLAPEVFMGLGYTYHVDWWSLGILFYECIYGRRPFVRNVEGQASLRAYSFGENVIQRRVEFPETYPLVSSECIDAISCLLEKDPLKRIGANGFTLFTRHAYFKDINFAALQMLEISPIFVPSADKMNFDTIYDLEELLLEDVPLEARMRRGKSRRRRPPLHTNATLREIRAEELHGVLEAQFKVFDYTKHVVPIEMVMTMKVYSEEDEKGEREGALLERGRGRGSGTEKMGGLPLSGNGIVSSSLVSSLSPSPSSWVSSISSQLAFPSAFPSALPSALPSASPPPSPPASPSASSSASRPALAPHRCATPCASLLRPPSPVPVHSLHDVISVPLPAPRRLSAAYRKSIVKSSATISLFGLFLRRHYNDKSSNSQTQSFHLSPSPHHLPRQKYPPGVIGKFGSRKIIN